MSKKGKNYDTLNSLLHQLKKECQLCGYPMFVTVAIDDNGFDTNYITHTVSPAACNKELSNDRFTGLSNVMIGFDTVPQREIIELEL